MAALLTRAINHPSRARQQSSRLAYMLLASQTITSHGPMRTPEHLSRLCGLMRIHTQPHVPNEHARHHKTVFSEYSFPSHLSVFGQRTLFGLGGSRHGWELLLDQIHFLHTDYNLIKPVWYVVLRKLVFVNNLQSKACTPTSKNVRAWYRMH